MSTPNENHRQANLSRIVETRCSQFQQQRHKTRDYGRILRQSNTPAYWYQATSPRTHSIYYYDPQYQRLLQQTKKLQNTPVCNQKLMFSITDKCRFDFVLVSPSSITNSACSTTDRCSKKSQS